MPTNFIFITAILLLDTGTTSTGRTLHRRNAASRLGTAMHALQGHSIVQVPGTYCPCTLARVQSRMGSVEWYLVLVKTVLGVVLY